MWMDQRFSDTFENGKGWEQGRDMARASPRFDTRIALESSKIKLIILTFLKISELVKRLVERQGISKARELQ